MRNFERNQPVMLHPANPVEDTEPAPPSISRAPSRFPAAAFIFAALLSACWIGMWGAYLWGAFGLQVFASLDLQQLALFAAAMALPPALFIAIAAALARASQMGRSAEALQDAAGQLLA